MRDGSTNIHSLFILFTAPVTSKRKSMDLVCVDLDLALALLALLTPLHSSVSRTFAKDSALTSAS